MLEARRRAQRVVHACLAEAAAALVPGRSERDAAQLIRERVAAHGATRWFHEPYVWFGAETAPTRRRRIAEYHPGDRRVERGMPVIFDAAPLLDGMIVDASYSFACGADPSPALRDVLAALAAVRALVPKIVATARGPGDVYRAIDELVTARGCRACHRLTPFGPLAHRIDGIRSVDVGVRIAGVDVGTLVTLGGGDVLARIAGRASPLWTPSLRSKKGAGLWSIEPHVARGDVGAKFEEVLVVDDDGARWLDADSWLAS
jgi:Xaa-Pro aminopeptidase